MSQTQRHICLKMKVGSLWVDGGEGHDNTSSLLPTHICLGLSQGFPCIRSSGEEDGVVMLSIDGVHVQVHPLCQTEGRCSMDQGSSRRKRFEREVRWDKTKDRQQQICKQWAGPSDAQKRLQGCFCFRSADCPQKLTDPRLQELQRTKRMEKGFKHRALGGC